MEEKEEGERFHSLSSRDDPKSLSFSTTHSLTLPLTFRPNFFFPDRPDSHLSSILSQSLIPAFLPLAVKYYSCSQAVGLLSVISWYICYSILTTLERAIARKVEMEESLMEGKKIPI